MSIPGTLQEAVRRVLHEELAESRLGEWPGFRACYEVGVAPDVSLFCALWENLAEAEAAVEQARVLLEG